MKIGFCGPFCDTNFGDYAMLINDVMDIGEKYITIFSYNIANIDSVIERYLKNFNIRKCNVEVESAAVITEGKQYKVAYEDYTETPLEMLQKITNLPEVEKEIKNIDKLVVTGGGFLNRIWTANHRKAKLFSILSIMHLADKYRKEIILMGNTIGPFDESMEFFEMFLGTLKHPVWGIRDAVLSRRYLKRIGIDADVHDLPDDIYFLNQNLQFENGEVQEKLQRMTGGQSYILIELYDSLSEVENMLLDFKQFALQMYQKFHRIVIFVALDKKYGGYFQGKTIEKSWEESPRIHMWNQEVMEYMPIEELAYLVKNASFVLCERYHLSVFSLAANTPFVQVLKDVCGDKRYYYIKTMGILKKILCGEEFQDSLFLQTSLHDALLLLGESITELEARQKQLFRQSKQKNEKEQYEVRKEYIRNFLRYENR